MSASRGRKRRAEKRASRIRKTTSQIEQMLGLEKGKMFRTSTRARSGALRKTALALFVLFGNLRGKTISDRAVTQQDVAAVDAFIRRVGGAKRFGFDSKEQLSTFRDALLSARRLVVSTSLSDADRGRLASKLIGPVVEKIAFLHPDFRSVLDDLARIHVDVANESMGRGGKIYNGKLERIVSPPRLSRKHTYLATNVKLITHEGTKEYTDSMMISFAHSGGPFVLKDNLKLSIAVFNENKAPSVINESNYQHADALSRLSGAQEMVFSIGGKVLRVKPEDVIYSAAAVQQVTFSVKGRFGGATRVAMTTDPNDWVHSMKYVVPKDKKSAQLRVVLSLREEALLELAR